SSRAWTSWTGSARAEAPRSPATGEALMRCVTTLTAAAGLAVLGIAAAPAAAMQKASPEAPMANTLTDAERAAGWRLLFDGETTAGWRGYRQERVPAGWQAVDGALTRVGEAGDIITADTFRDFDLSLEWR